MSALHDRLDRASATPLPARVLRVFGGRLDGAEHPLTPGQQLGIGHAFDNALVLRGKGTSGTAIVLRVDPETASVVVTEGEIGLLGARLAAGTTALLPPYVPLMIGEYAIAVGDPADGRWDEVPALLAAPRVTVVDPAPGDRTVAAGFGDWAMREGEALARRLPFTQRPLLMIGASLALLAAAVATPTYRTIRSWVNSPDAVEQTIAAAGFRDLRVRRDPLTRALVIEGRLRDDAQVERLRAFANDRYGGVRLNVSTASGAAAAITEFLKAQGIDAEARPARGGIVVHSEYLPQDRLSALRGRMARDLPDTGPVRFVRDLARGPRDLQYFFASKRFGLASLVDGDPGHIVTADGQYWFAGALLPTGHRLLSVRNGAIRFERDGLVETLQVAPAGAPPPPSTPSPSTTAGLVGPATRS